MSKFRTPYDGVDKSCKLSFYDDNGEKMISCTEQHHKNDCDVNIILRKYDKTGLITHVNNAVKIYGDYSEVNEYQENLNMVISAQNAFNELPSNIRKKFVNNPGQFFEFATNPENLPEMVKLGLANPPKVVEEIIQKVEIVTPTQG
jgi:phage internal scaffolding protein